jgi:hypothetical protein
MIKTRHRSSFGGRYKRGKYHRHEPSLRTLKKSATLLHSYVPLPKSSRPERIKSNAQVFDFELDRHDMDTLEALDRGGEGAVTWNPVDEP